LAATTWNGYESKIRCHILPNLGKVRIRRLKATQIDRLYEKLLHPPGDARPLAPKSVMEVHQIIRSSLAEAQRLGIVSRNVAMHAHPPRARGVPRPEQKAWTAAELQTFLRAAAGHRLFPAFWLVANTGMRRNEVLGLQWRDFDPKKRTLSVNRGIVDVGYEVHQTRGKTRRSRRLVNLDKTTVKLLRSWQSWRNADAEIVGATPADWMFADNRGEPVHPQSVSQAFERIVNQADVPTLTLHELRHTHATLLLKEEKPVKVVSERLGHSNPAYTMATYQHVLPGMQAQAADAFEQLIKPKNEGHRSTKAQAETVEETVEDR
jgi:integrase